MPRVKKGRAVAKGNDSIRGSFNPPSRGPGRTVHCSRKKPYRSAYQGECLEASVNLVIRVAQKYSFKPGLFGSLTGAHLLALPMNCSDGLHEHANKFVEVAGVVPSRGPASSCASFEGPTGNVR